MKEENSEKSDEDIQRMFSVIPGILSLTENCLVCKRNLLESVFIETVD